MYAIAVLRAKAPSLPGPAPESGRRTRRLQIAWRGPAAPIHFHPAPAPHRRHPQAPPPAPQAPSTMARSLCLAAALLLLLGAAQAKFHGDGTAYSGAQAAGAALGRPVSAVSRAGTGRRCRPPGRVAAVRWRRQGLARRQPRCGAGSAPAGARAARPHLAGAGRRRSVPDRAATRCPSCCCRRRRREGRHWLQRLRVWRHRRPLGEVLRRAAGGPV